MQLVCAKTTAVKTLYIFFQKKNTVHRNPYRGNRVAAVNRVLGSCDVILTLQFPLDAARIATLLGVGWFSQG
jgi:hypothetical protein